MLRGLFVKEIHEKNFVAKKFMDHVYCSYRLPHKIISDLESILNSKFCKELFNILNIEISSSMAYNPQADGYSKRNTRTLEEMFFVSLPRTKTIEDSTALGLKLRTTLQ